VMDQLGIKQDEKVIDTTEKPKPNGSPVTEVKPRIGE